MVSTNVKMIIAGLVVCAAIFVTGYLLIEEASVSFRMEASFVYRGSDRNLPIDNVAIRFPCPNIDNSTDEIEQRVGLVLVFQDSDNKIYPEIIMRIDGSILQVISYRGSRKENIKLILLIQEPTAYGPKIFLNVDRLYPGEGILVTDDVSVSKALATRLTLRDFLEDNRTRVYYDHWPLEVEKIKLSFRVVLQIMNNNSYKPIENYYLENDAAPPGGLWLKQS